MIRFLLLISLLFFLLLISSVLPSDSVLYKEVSRRDLGGISYNEHEPTFAIANGYIGIVTEKRAGNRFILYDSTGNQKFTIMPDSGVFSWIQMNENCDKILVRHTFGECNSDYYVYNYSGQKIFTIEKSASDLSMAPSCSYYYTKNDFILCNSTPKVFGSDGGLLGEFSANSDRWQLTPISDTSILLQDGSLLRLIALPGMITLKEISIDNIDPSDFPILSNAVSPDGRFYAFCGQDKIALCDLSNESIDFLTLPPSEKRIACAQLAIGPEGKYLITWHNTGSCTIYRRTDKGFKHSVISLHSDDTTRIPPCIVKPRLGINYFALNCLPNAGSEFFYYLCKVGSPPEKYDELFPSPGFIYDIHETNDAAVFDAFIYSTRRDKAYLIQEEAHDIKSNK